MTPIPTKIKKEILADPFYKFCSLRGHQDHECAGRITFEHALIFQGRQLQKKFAIIPLCARGHEVDNYQDAGTMKKDMNVWVALNRANEEELSEISKVISYTRIKNNLNEKYGVWEPILLTA